MDLQTAKQSIEEGLSKEHSLAVQSELEANQGRFLLETLTRQHQALHEEFIATSLQFDSERRKDAGLQYALDQARTELAEAKALGDTLAAMLATAQIDHRDAEKNRAALLSSLSETQGRLAAALADNCDLARQRSESQSSLSEAQAALIDAKTAYGNLDAVAAALREDCQALQRRIDGLANEGPVSWLKRRLEQARKD
jgi:chromosome segregation ATPase